MAFYNGLANGRGVALLTVALILALPACSSDDGLAPFTPAPDASPDANEIVSGIDLGAASGIYVDAIYPAVNGIGPVLLGARQYVQGNSVLIQVTTDDAATQLLVGVGSTASGYWTVDLPAAKSAAAQTYVITVNPNLESGRTIFAIRVASTDGTTLTPFTSHTVSQSSAAGSGQLQVSLNWIHANDVDLHVETPEGQDIYWGQRSGSSGGELDLDSNAGCGVIDYIHNENITWLNTVPTSGTYTVRVNLWAVCEEGGPGPYPYILSVIVGGQQTLIDGILTQQNAFAAGDLAGNHDARNFEHTFTIGP